MPKSVFIKGALVLSAAAFFSKLLGLFYVIPLKHFAGDEGLALYQAVFPIYNTLLILSVSGIPIAISKLISEEKSGGNASESDQILISAMRMMSVVALAGFFVFFLGADQLARWIGNEDTRPSIQALAFAMLIVPFVALLRGYFYGHQQMALPAVSQVIEQLIRVSLMIGFVYWLVQEGGSIAKVASGAAWGSFFGLACALALLLFIFLRTSPKISFPSQAKGGYAKKILLFALPASFSTLMLPIMGMVDSLTIINLLKASGLSQLDSTVEFGLYSRGVPIVQFSAFYATALGVAVVPALASETSQEKKGKKIYQTIKITFLIGVPASIGMMLIAEPLNILFYGDDQGSEALIVLAASTFFLSLSVTASGLLQGLGKPIVPAACLGIGILVKLGLNVWLIPSYGIVGAAYSTLFTYGCIAILCLKAVLRTMMTPLVPGKQVGRWLLPSVGMGIAVAWAMTEFLHYAPILGSQRLFSFYEVILLLIIGLVSYGIGLMICNIITWQDLSMLWQDRLMRKQGNSRVSVQGEYDIAHIHKKKDGMERE